MTSPKLILVPKLTAYVAGLALMAAVTAAALVLLGYGLESPWTILVLAVAAAIAERGSIRITSTTEQSISLVPMLFAAVLAGPLAGGIVGAATELGDSEVVRPAAPGRSPRLKWVTYTSTRFMVGAAMGLVAQAAIALAPSKFGAVIAATLVGATVGEALEIAFAAVTSRVRGNKTEVAKAAAPLVITAACVYAPTVALLTFAYIEISPWTAPLFLAPALAAHRLFGEYQEKSRLASDLSIANAALEKANISFAAALIATLDARDQYTAGHSAAVAIYSRDIATRMSLSEDRCDLAYLCGLVHDIGKIGLPAGLLEKPGALTLEERRHMEKHSEIGERILSNVEDYAEIATIVRHHHERIDGEGYPDRVSGDDIPLLSKIIAVADAYNAMTSDRPYRDAMPSRVARLRLAQAVESQFDTSVVAAFEAILAGESEDYRMARRAEFQSFANTQTASTELEDVDVAIDAA